VDEVEARELARRELGNENLVITDAKRIGQTWVVSYNSRKYVETGDLRYYETGPSLRILVSDDGRVVRAPGSTRPTRPSGSKTLAESLAESEQQQP
jgi:hypothetical protein